MLADFALKVLLEVAELKRRTYYNNLNKDITNAKDEHIKQCMLEINKKHKHYGSRRIRDALKRNYNINISRFKVRKLMDELGIVAKILTKRKPNTVGEKVPGLPRLFDGKTKAEEPFKVLCTDITYLNIEGRWHYLSAIIDTYNNEILAYKFSSHMRTEMVIETFDLMLQNYPDVDFTDTIIHSDQGSQYTSYDYFDWCGDHGLIRSYSRRGKSTDNGFIEGFWSRLKFETGYFDREFKTADQMSAAIDNYINYYNTTRISVVLDGLSPIEYRLNAA